MEDIQKPDKEYLTIRIDKELKSKLRQVAEKDQRSISNHVLKVLRKSVANAKL
jgi:predicted transcriptional regulator